MTKLFGTDGVRGCANKDLTPELAFKLGRAAGVLLKQDNNKAAIVVGRDTRLSGPMLEGALTAGITSAGVDVYLAGVIPTPAIAFLVRDLKCVAGAVISASHNPAPDNGIKFFNNKGYKLDDALEERIENIIEGGLAGFPRPIGNELGRIINLKDADDRYVSYLKSALPIDIKGLKIVLDCANGASFRVAPRLFNELGAQVISINDLPDGLNINDNCGSTYPKSLQEAVVKYKADLGLAFDGDADRVIAVDEKGQIVDGDKILVICGLFMQDNNILNDNKIVVTVMSNLGLKQAFEKAGISVLETKVGDRYVLEEMLKNGAILGGEQSGHIIFLEFNTTGDGVLSGINLVKIVKEKKKTLSKLAEQMITLPQILVNVKVKSKDGWEDNDRIKGALAEKNMQLKDKGRLLVRASGTEPLIRVMAEGPDKDELERITHDLADIISKELGF